MMAAPKELELHHASHFEQKKVNLCLIVANSRYSKLANLLPVEKDMHCMKKFLEEEHLFEVHVIPNSKDILKDVMKFTRGLSDEKKEGLANFHFYYSGHGAIKNYFEVDLQQHPVFETNEETRHKPKHGGMVGDMLYGVEGYETSEKQLVFKLVSHLFKFCPKAVFICLFDKCRSISKEIDQETLPTVNVQRDYDQWELGEVENSRVLILHATLEKQIAEGLGSFTQRLIQVTQNRPGKVLLYSDVEHELNATMNQQHCKVVWPTPVVRELRWYSKCWPLDTDPVIHLTAAEDLDWRGGLALGEYQLDGRYHGGCPVYKQRGGDRHLYRTHGGWAVSDTLGSEKDCDLMNMSDSGWQYKGNDDQYKVAPTLTRGIGPLPPCGVVTVTGGGKADGDYHADGGEYKQGRPVFVRRQQPAYKLYVSVSVYGYGYDWCVFSDKDSLVMSSNYSSVCPAGVARGNNNKWVHIPAIISCSVHRASK